MDSDAIRHKEAGGAASTSVVGDTGGVRGGLVAFWRERCGVGRYDSSRGRNVLVVVRRQRRRAQILKGGREVARATRALAGRVSVGEIPSVALEHVADDVEVLAQARRAQAVGGSVSDALIATSR